MFLERFYPKKYVRSIYTINWKKYYKMGYRGILFDIDNWLKGNIICFETELFLEVI